MSTFNAFLLCILLFITGISQAQPTYYFNFKTDGSILLAGGIATGLGVYYRNQTPTLSISAIEALKKSEVNGFDRIAIDNYSSIADTWSDVFWGGSHLLPLVFLTQQEGVDNFGKIGGMYGEVFLLNAGITALTKYSVRRARPFVYNPAVDIELKQRKTARTAFLSGHTSMTAVNCFFVAKVFSDLYPHSSWKPVVWSSAAVVPALTGYLRVKAGKHYPTDTIVGYALGAVVGILVPHLHKKRDNRLSVYSGGNGIAIKWRL